jgi:hypothetical protein
MAQDSISFITDFQTRILPVLCPHTAGTTFIHELITSQYKNLDIVELAATCKFWCENDTLPEDLDPPFFYAWTNAIPGHAAQYFCKSILFPELSDDVLETIRVRRDIEAPLVRTDMKRGNQQDAGGDVYAAIWNMYRVWLGKDGNCTTTLTCDYVIHYLLSVALQSQRAEQLFIEYLLTPAQDYYSSNEKKICLKLWRFSRTITNTAAVQRCLIGVTHHDVGNINSPWSTDQIVDVAALFKYIDIDTNNWFWLDVMASFPTATDEPVGDTGTRMSTTTPTYGIKKKYVNKLLHNTIDPKYRKLFQSDVLYFRIHNAVRVVFDTARRLFHSNSYKEAVMFIVNDNISRLPTYDYLDASPAKVQALMGDSYELLDRLGGEVLQGAPSMKSWLEDEMEGTTIRVLISGTTAIQITVRANIRLLELLYSRCFFTNALCLRMSLSASDLCALAGCLPTPAI